MAGRVEYQIEKYSFTEANEPARLSRQWADVLAECLENKAGAEERLRIALLNVDYVTSFELPFRLLLTRAPQLIADLREELQLSQKNVIFNGKRFGCVWSLKSDLSAVPDDYQYRLTTRIRRIEAAGATEAPYRLIAQQAKLPRERLKLALEDGMAVTALDALFWFGAQRIAADVQRLRKAGMKIATEEIDAYDNLTGTSRRIPVYKSALA